MIDGPWQGPTQSNKPYAPSEKREELKRIHKWPEEKHAKLLCKQQCLEFTVIHGGFGTEMDLPGAEHWLAFPHLSREENTNFIKANNSNYDRKLKRSYHVGYKLDEENIIGKRNDERNTLNTKKKKNLTLR